MPGHCSDSNSRTEPMHWIPNQVSIWFNTVSASFRTEHHEIRPFSRWMPLLHAHVQPTAVPTYRNSHRYTVYKQCRSPRSRLSHPLLTLRSPPFTSRSQQSKQTSIPSTMSSVAIIAMCLLAILCSLSSACTVYPNQGDNKVVIGMAGRCHGNWQQWGHKCAYKPWLGKGWHEAHSIDQPGGDGNSRIYINFQVPYNSEYVLTMVSETINPTEFNDVWGRIWNGQHSAQNMDLRCECNRGNKRGMGNGYFKMYQNKSGWSNEIWTVDHNPHAITGYFHAGKTYTLELSGRSYHFVIDKLAFVACSGSGCSPRAGHVQGALNSGGNACYWSRLLENANWNTSRRSVYIYFMTSPFIREPA